MNANVTIYDDLEQGTDEWLQARCGVLTASTIGKLITPTLKIADNETARGLLHTLTAERITGTVDYVHPTFDMQRGTEDEPVARAYYEESFAPVTEVGFVTLEQDGYKLGYSPDGLVEGDGLIEIKSRRPSVHMKTIAAGRVPGENMAQIQTGLFVTGRDWCDYISYSPGLPLYVIRVAPDPAWFDVIHAAATEFETRVAALTTRYNIATAGMPATAPREDDTELELKL